MKLTQREAYLDQKFELYKKMLQITKNVKENLAVENLDKIPEYLKERKKVMSKIDHLDDVYSKYALNSAKHPELAGKINRLKEMLTEIIDSDKEISQQIQKITRLRSQEYNQVKQVRKVQYAYDKHRIQQGNLINKQR